MTSRSFLDADVNFKLYVKRDAILFGALYWYKDANHYCASFFTLFAEDMAFIGRLELTSIINRRENCGRSQ